VTVVGRREERRAARRREVLDAAMEIVAAEGLPALTIARLADAVDAAVGALYRYFPGKEHLLVALQVRATDDLRAALEERLATVERAARRLDPAPAALAAAAAVPLGYLAEARRAPARHRLTSAFLASPEPVLGEAEAAEVEAAVAPILTLAAERLDAAARGGALAPGDARRRTTLAWAAVQGLTLFHNRDRLQPARLRVGALAGPLLESLLRGWGGEPDAVARGVALARRRVSP